MKGKGILLLLMVLFLSAYFEVLIEDYIAGTWELKTYLLNDMDLTMEMNISDVSSIADFSAAHSTLSTSLVDVEIISGSEYVYSFENGGDTQEFRFLKK